MARNAHPVNPGEPAMRDPMAAKAHAAPANYPAAHRPRTSGQQGTGGTPQASPMGGGGAAYGGNAPRRMPKVNRNYAD